MFEGICVGKVRESNFHLVIVYKIVCRFLCEKERQASNVFWFENNTSHIFCVLSKLDGGKGIKPKICDLLLFFYYILEMLYML
jgi:hypothetical protein